MPQQKQKGKRLHFKHLPLIVISSLLGLLIVVIIGAFIVKDITAKQTAQKQKDLLNQSLKEVEHVYYKFGDSITFKKEYSQKPVNLCSQISSIAVNKDYGCGNRSEIKVFNLSQEDYLILDTKFKEIYNQNRNFSYIKNNELDNLSYKNELVNSSNSKYQNSQLRCFYYSTYAINSMNAVFGMGCSLTAKSPIFLLDNY